jgi:hypothetical protein
MPPSFFPATLSTIISEEYSEQPHRLKMTIWSMKKCALICESFYSGEKIDAYCNHLDGKSSLNVNAIKQQLYETLLDKYSPVISGLSAVDLNGVSARLEQPRLDKPRDLYGNLWPMSHFQEPDIIIAKVVTDNFHRDTKEIRWWDTYKKERRKLTQ